MGKCLVRRREGSPREGKFSLFKASLMFQVSLYPEMSRFNICIGVAYEGDKGSTSFGHDCAVLIENNQHRMHFGSKSDQFSILRPNWFAGLAGTAAAGVRGRAAVLQSSRALIALWARDWPRFCRARRKIYNETICSAHSNIS